jgi:hypothetical protein
MGCSGQYVAGISKKEPRKENKLRPYRVDYFIHDEMLKDKALVRSIVVRVVTAAEAKAIITKYASPDDYTVIRAYRFYKKLSPEPKIKKYIPIDKLLPVKKAIEVMTGIENRRDRIIISPSMSFHPPVNDLGNTPAAQTQMDAVAEQHDKAEETTLDEVLANAPAAPAPAPAAPTVDVFSTPMMDPAALGGPADAWAATRKCGWAGCKVCYPNPPIPVQREPKFVPDSGGAIIVISIVSAVVVAAVLLCRYFFFK